MTTWIILNQEHILILHRIYQLFFHLIHLVNYFFGHLIL